MGTGFRLDWAMHSVDDFKIVSGQQVKLAPPLQRERFNINPKLPKSYSGLGIDGIALKLWHSNLKLIGNWKRKCSCKNRKVIEGSLKKYFYKLYKI